MTNLQIPLHTMLRGCKGQIWVLALMAFLATVVAIEGPTVLQAQTERTLNLGSLSIADPNGTTVDIGTFESTTRTYSAEVADSMEQVTVSAAAESASDVHVYISPGDSQRNSDGHQVNLNHGKNIIFVATHSFWVDETLRVYTIEINRAGTASQSAANYVKSSSIPIAREGSTVPFLFTRSGDTSQKLKISVDIWGTNDTGLVEIIPGLDPVTLKKRVEVEFLEGYASAQSNQDTTNDSLYHGNSVLGVTVVEGNGYSVSSNGGYASTRIWDDDYSKPTLASLSLTDQNGSTVPFGEFDPDESTYSANVASETTHVTVTPSTTPAASWRFITRVLPSDSQPDVIGHQVALNHGVNLITVVVMSPVWENSAILGTYNMNITRAGSPSDGATTSVGVYGISNGKEGTTMPFLLTRTGDTSQSLTVPVDVSETGGDMVPVASKGRFEVEFIAGNASASFEVPTVADRDWEEHSTITVAVVDGDDYEFSAESSSASSTVADNDVPNVTASFEVDSSEVQEGEVATVSIALKTDGAKEPHNYVGTLWFIIEPGTVQEEEVRLPDSGRDPEPWIKANAYGRPSDRKIALSVSQRDLQPVMENGLVQEYRYEMTVPIIIVDDVRAEGDETFDINVDWGSDFKRRNNLTMDKGITLRTITIPAHDDTPGAYSSGSYVTVVITHSGSAGSTYTVSWHDTGRCAGSRKYEVYLTRRGTGGGTMLSKLGETAHTNTQFTVSKDSFPLKGQRNVQVYCGNMNRTVGEVPLPSATENSVERPVPGTYSSQPALTSLTITPGTLGPAFNSHGFLYSVLDVPNGDNQITLDATARDGYTISWDPSEDADAAADGHQVDLSEGYNNIFVSVDHDQDINSFTYEVIVKGAGVLVSQQVNTEAAGSPTISGTPEVGETLTASTSGVTDADGLANASYSYQWIANDGTSDSDIADATASTYTLVAADAGKTIKVTVTFTDDGGNEETLTSAATTEVAATLPSAPGSLKVSVKDAGKLDLSWNAPDTNGGSAVTGYKVQWKEAVGSWDTPADVSETTVTSTSHSVSGLTDGTEYTFRVIAVNSVGDGTASAEESGTPRETTAPTVSEAAVDSATLTLSFSEDLAETPLPAATTFSVSVGGSNRGVDSVAISGSTVTLTLSSAVTSTDAVAVSYTVPSDAPAARLKDLSDNAAESFSGQEVVNNTVASVPALTASVHDEPSSHDGQTGFTFELRFSENLEGFSYRTLRDHAFTVTGGEVKGARRLEPGKNIRWEVKIGPTSSGNVTVVLPETTDCDAQGAICTEDGRKLSAGVELVIPGPPNSAATGAPTISGTAQVGGTLTAATTTIADADGLTNASYTYQWVSNDGTSDSDIADAAASAYTLAAADAGRTIRVRVTFTDDGGNEETLTSAATAVVAAGVPGVPGGLSVSVNDTGKLDLSWNAPTSNGGSAITGYKVQWKESAGSWDTAEDVSETTVAGTSHTVSGLADGTEYTFRIVAVNSAGDGSASTEESGTPRETTAPTVASAAVDGGTLTLTFSEELTEAPVPAVTTFTVSVGGNQRGVDSAAISGSTVSLTLASAVTSTDAVTVSYAVPSEAAAARLKDLSDNAAESFADRAVTNDTAAARTPLTAGIHDQPTSHDGQNAFTFELRFSETPRDDFSYVTLRDHAFTVTGGEVVNARRLEPGKNIRWEITVQPSGNAVVTIVLPVTTDCAADGAICTGDGRMLSTRLELAVSGPGG